MLHRLAAFLLAAVLLTPPSSADLFSCHADGRVDVHDAADPTQVVATYPREASWPNPLVRALALAEATPGGDVVRVVGDLYQEGRGVCDWMSWGDRDSVGRYVGEVVDVTIEGVRGPATAAYPEGEWPTIGNLSCSKRDGRRIERITVRGISFVSVNRDLILWSGFNLWDMAGPGTAGSAQVGAVFQECRFYNPAWSPPDDRVQSHPPLGWFAGQGPKFGSRGSGPSSGFAFRRCGFYGLSEHGIYHDNVSGFEVSGCLFVECWRAGVQVTNRIWKSEPGYPLDRPGDGFLDIRRNTFDGCGYSGAASISLFGNLGHTRVLQNRIVTDNRTYGVLLTYEGPNHPAGKLGSHLTAEGYAFGTAEIGGNVFVMTQSAGGTGGQRHIVALGGVGRTQFYAQDFTGNTSGRPDVQFFVPGQSGRPNGTYSFVTRRQGDPPPSAWAWSEGFWDANPGNDWGGQNHRLTAEELDARASWR